LRSHPAVLDSFRLRQMTDTDLAFASIEEVAHLYRKRKLSPVDVTKLMLARIDQLNPKLNAYITVTAEVALAQAKKSEAELFAPRGHKGHRDRGPLHGIPISLKDNIYTKDIRTTAGSKILKDFVPLHDAVVWAKLKEAGAILLGKTNLHEFAYGVTTTNPHYGPTRNPWDLACIPGGSSGGSAAAVAAGLCYGSIGTDTGGSIRIPASLCGVVGLKPGIGRVSVEGVVPLSPRLDFVGPLARTVADAALLLDPIFLRGKNEPSLFSPQKFSARSLRKLRLGLPKELFFDVLPVDVHLVFEEAVRQLQNKGATITEVSIPLLSETEQAGNHIAWPEATHYHQQAGWFPAHSAEYGEDVRVRLEMGTRISASAYLEALETRDKFSQQFHLAMADASIDALIAPTTPIVAPLIGEESTRIGDENHPTRAILLRLNRPANLAGIPAISVPCGFAAGLPVGLQLIGAVTDELPLLRIARMFEELDPQRKTPPVATRAVGTAAY
jgi:aspartyl-tRNA(Asn)/glutamyl-tRNA(Gln) amidotransferase subunit A